MEDDIWQWKMIFGSNVQVASTNAIECRNKDCKSDTPQCLKCLKLSIIKIYKIDKVACLKHNITVKGGLSYRSRSEEARRSNALSKQKQCLKSISDPESQYGPLDCATKFSTSSRKRAEVDLPSPSNASKRQAVSIDNGIMNVFLSVALKFWVNVPE